MKTCKFHIQIIFCISLIVSMSSCSVHQHKSRTSALLEATTKIDSSLLIRSTGVAQVTMTEIITEKIDTSTTIPGWTYRKAIQPGEVSLPDGGKIIFKANHPDSFIITVPAKVVGFRYSRRKETHRKISGTEETTLKTRTERKEVTTLKNRAADKSSHVSYRSSWLIFGGILIAVSVAGYITFRIRRRS